jgi:hypothetical protein
LRRIKKCRLLGQKYKFSFDLASKERISAKCLVGSTIMCIFAQAIKVNKELLMFTQIAENFGLLYVTNS